MTVPDNPLAASHPIYRNRNWGRDAAIASSYTAGVSVSTLAQIHALSRGRTNEIVRQGMRRKEGKAFPWCLPEFALPSPKHPFDYWPQPQYGVEVQKIIVRYRIGKPLWRIAAEVKDHQSNIENVVRMWNWRVIAIAYERGLWKFPEEYMPSLGRPLDMGGPRDEWIERDPWSEQ